MKIQMKKLLIAAMAVGMFSALPVFAGEHGNMNMKKMDMHEGMKMDSHEAAWTIVFGGAEPLRTGNGLEKGKAELCTSNFLMKGGGHPFNITLETLTN